MQQFKNVIGNCLPLHRADVDTDQIIPAKYLKRIERTGFGEFLFDTWKKDPDFILNDSRYASASILLASALACFVSASSLRISASSFATLACISSLDLGLSSDIISYSLGIPPAYQPSGSFILFLESTHSPFLST